jgi:DinB family protein
VKQEALRERLLIELDLLTVDVTAVMSPLTPAQILWPPPGGGWTIGHLLEHVVLGAEHYLVRMRPLIYRPGAPLTRAAEHDWEPRLSASLLVSVLKSKRKWRAPRLIRAPEPRPDLLKAFQHQQDGIHALLLAAADLDWNRIGFTSPYNRLIRLNLGDAFTVLVVHGQRHALQMQRVRDLPGFGKG